MPATSARAAFVQEEYRSAVWSDADVRTIYGKVARDTKDAPIPTFFDDIADVQAMVDERGALLGGHARAFRVTVGQLMDLSNDLDMRLVLPGAHLKADELVADLDTAVFAIEAYDTEREQTVLGLWGKIESTGGGGISNAAAFSPDYKQPNLALSNSNRTVTKNTNNAYAVAGVTEAKATGLWYFEVTIDNLVTGNLAIGLGPYLADLENPLGSDANHIGYFNDNRVRYSAANQPNPPGSYTTGDIISVAYDAANRRVHFRKNGGAWANSGDPAGNSGGYVISGTQPLMPLVLLYYSGTAVTANFGASAFAHSPPAGFSAWTKTARTGHRYWRIHQNDSNMSPEQFVIAEAQLRETSGGADQTGSGTASASSVWDGTGTYAPSKAVDNDPATIWHTANGAGINAWWQYDFGAGVTKDITELVYTIRSDSLGYSTQFRLVYSDDGSTWYPLLGYSSQTWPSAGSTRTFTLTP